jgi:hypothetical protein
MRRFIVASSLAVAIGVALVPQWAGNDLVRAQKGTSNQMLANTAVIIIQVY